MKKKTKNKIKSRIVKLVKGHHYLFFKYNDLLNFKRKRNYKKIIKTTKLDDKLILFVSFMGRKYVDSPKAIYEYMLKNKKYQDYKFVWAFKNPIEKKEYFDTDRTILIKYNTKNFLEYCAKSKYLITNSRLPKYLVKRKNQIFVQCWHGTPLKKIGCDIDIFKTKYEKKENDLNYEIEAKQNDYMISPSKYCTEKLISAFRLKKFNKENIIIEKGYPRNDFLFNYTDNDVKKIKNKLNLPKDKKVILYAPTFRDNQQRDDFSFVYELGINFDRLQEELKKDYVILFRTHYFVVNKFDFTKYKNFIYNVSDYEDINDLYIISDILITDYSSVFFDYANLKRPILFYMYDLDEYKNNLRDFYISLDELPGSILKKETELLDKIKNIKNFKYDNKYKEFNKKFNYLDDGNATKRVVEVIFNEKS